MTLKVLEQSISSLYKTGEGSPLEEALEAYRSRLQEKEAILVNEQQVTNKKKQDYRRLLDHQRLGENQIILD